MLFKELVQAEFEGRKQIYTDRSNNEAGVGAAAVYREEI